jgi:hypothetical protein
MSGLGRSRVHQIHVRFGSKSALNRPIVHVTLGICQDSCTRRGWIRVLLLSKVSCSYALCLLCNVHGHSSQPNGYLDCIRRCPTYCYGSCCLVTIYDISNICSNYFERQLKMYEKWCLAIQSSHSVMGHGAKMGSGLPSILKQVWKCSRAQQLGNYHTLALYSYNSEGP